jgi:hypothetical protein
MEGAVSHLRLVGGDVQLRPKERRTRQHNTRYTPSEDRRLQQVAGRQGYRNPSEFQRDAVLSVLSQLTTAP